MFCEKCGSQIQGGASFCTNCGTKLGEEKNSGGAGNFNNYQRPIISNEAQAMATNGGVEALNLLKDPISTIKGLKEKDKTPYLVVGGITVIVSIITTIIMLSIIEKSFGGYLSMVLGTSIFSSTFKMIIYAVLFDIAIMAGVGGIAFGGLKFGYSDGEATYFSGLKISIAAYFYMKVLFLIGLIICFISTMLGAIAIIISLIAYIILIFCGINESAEYRGSISFYMTIACIVSTFIINYVFLKILG